MRKIGPKGKRLERQAGDERDARLSTVNCELSEAEMMKERDEKKKKQWVMKNARL